MTVYWDYVLKKVILSNSCIAVCSKLQPSTFDQNLAPFLSQAMGQYVDAYHDYVSAIRLNNRKCTYFSCRYTKQVVHES